QQFVLERFRRFPDAVSLWIDLVHDGQRVPPPVLAEFVLAVRLFFLDRAAPRLLPPSRGPDLLSAARPPVERAGVGLPRLQAEDLTNSQGMPLGALVAPEVELGIVLIGQVQLEVPLVADLLIFRAEIAVADVEVLVGLVLELEGKGNVLAGPVGLLVEADRERQAVLLGEPRLRFLLRKHGSRR